jgi:hypothetical protein
VQPPTRQTKRFGFQIRSRHDQRPSTTRACFAVAQPGGLYRSRTGIASRNVRKYLRIRQFIPLAIVDCCIDRLSSFLAGLQPALFVCHQIYLVDLGPPFSLKAGFSRASRSPDSSMPALLASLLARSHVFLPPLIPHFPFAS